MILAFADDSTVRVFDTIEEANGYCETIDVENQEYTFLDERGYVLKPIVVVPVEKKRLWFFSTCSPGSFTLERTDKRKVDLIRRLEIGGISIDHGPTSVRSLGDLKAKAPLLFEG